MPKQQQQQPLAWKTYARISFNVSVVYTTRTQLWNMRFNLKGLHCLTKPEFIIFDIFSSGMKRIH